MTKIYIVFGLLVIILCSCLSTFYFRNMTETFQTKSPNHIVFLTKEELTEFIENDNDKYFASFSNDDLQIRNARTIHEYKQAINDSFCSVTPNVQDKITQSILKIENQIQKMTEKDNWDIDFEKLVHIPWKIGCTCNTKYENGFPHTREDIIILPMKQIDSMDEQQLCKLLIHEKVHIYQRLYSTEIENMLKKRGFQKNGTRENNPANPDLNAYTYTHYKLGDFYSTYKNEPSTFKDIQYANGSSSSEHPYEYIAYAIAESFE
jgi:hypothetical protein